MFANKDLTQIDERDLRRGYDRLFARGRWLKDRSSLMRWVLQRLNPLPGRRLLDVACGDGQLAPLATSAGLDYFGVDIAHAGIIQIPIATALTANGQDLPFPDASFDYVINIGSLEHFVDMARCVREMRRVLKPQGAAFFVVPNAFGLTWNVLGVWRTGDLADDDGQPLQRFASRGAWQRVLSENGLMPVRVYGFERVWPRTRGDWQLYLDEPREILLALIAPFLPTNARRSLAFLCQKAS